MNQQSKKNLIDMSLYKIMGFWANVDQTKAPMYNLYYGLVAGLLLGIEDPHMARQIVTTLGIDADKDSM